MLEPEQSRRPNWRFQLSPVQREIRDLAQEARARLETGSVDAPDLRRLIARLDRCADAAAAAGLGFSEQQLDQLAAKLERRLELLRQPPD
jgi:hypothetical protein